jgi:hypothetical protein
MESDFLNFTIIPKRTSKYKEGLKCEKELSQK